MRHKIARFSLAVVFAIAVMTSLAAPAHAWDQPCSAAGVAGNWGFTDTGTVIGIGPRTAVGVWTLDGKGNLVNGVATSSINGSIASETFSGTYTVNPDCTGTISVTIYASGVELFTVTGFTAFDDGMRELRGLFTSVTTPSGAALQTVVSLQARKQ